MKRIPSVRTLEKAFGRRIPIDEIRDELERWRDTGQSATVTMRKVSNLLRLGELGVLEDEHGDELGLFLVHRDGADGLPTLVYRHDTGTMSLVHLDNEDARLRANGTLRANVTPRIVSYYETWDEDAVEAGDTDDKGDLHDDEIELDEYDIDEGLTVVDLAVKYLVDAGVAHVSASHFHPGVWYTTDDEVDFRTGDRTIESYHLKGFDLEDEREIFRRMVAR